MLKKELRDLSAEISQELQLPMEETQNVIEAFLEKVTERTAQGEQKQLFHALLTGIPPLDQNMRIHPGITVIYSQPDGGRTSLAKRLALSAFRQGMVTMYYDVENKLTLHDRSLFSGIGVAKSYQESGLKELVAKGLIDFMVVDTITGMYHTSHESFLIKLRKKVPFIIVLTQMRDSIAFQKSVPAARDHVLSSAHTALYLAGKEQQAIEGVTVMRIQYQCTKYESDRSREGERGSFIVRNNLVDTVYTVYDYLESRGLVCSRGKETYYQGNAKEIPLGSINQMLQNKEAARYFISLGLREMNLQTQTEVYCD